MLCTCRLAIEIDEKQAHITQTRARCQKMQGKRIIFFLLFIVWTYFKNVLYKCCLEYIRPFLSFFCQAAAFWRVKYPKYHKNSNKSCAMESNFLYFIEKTSIKLCKDITKTKKLTNIEVKKKLSILVLKCTFVVKIG